jgi:hypothetical protein
LPTFGGEAGRPTDFIPGIGLDMLTLTADGKHLFA